MHWDRASMMLVSAVLVGGLGCAWEIVVRARKVRGYSYIASDVRRIAAAVHGEVDRDGSDVIVRVNIQRCPVVVRFSHSDGEPGLNMRTPVAVTWSLFCVPRSLHDAPTTSLIFSEDAAFDARFRINTTDVGGRLLLSSPNVLTCLKRLCCSPRTFLAIEDKYLEVSELTIPEGGLEQHVIEHLDDLAEVAKAICQLPGTDATHISAFRRTPNWFHGLYVAVLVLVALSLGLGDWLRSMRVHPPSGSSPAEVQSVETGIAAADAAQIPGLASWHLAQSLNFDADGISWLQQQGQQPKGHIEGAFGGDSTDSAYILVNPGGEPQPRRLVMLIKGQVRFDASLPRIDVAARIPQNQLSKIEWLGPAPVGEADGDGLLIVRNYADPAGSMVLYWSGVHLLSGNPRDFHRISLQ